MPIIVCLKNGIQVVVHGNQIDPAEWKPKARVKKLALNGHPVLIAASEVVLLEEFTEEQFKERAEKVQAEKEAAMSAQGRLLAKPALAIPRGR